MDEDNIPKDDELEHEDEPAEDALDEEGHKKPKSLLDDDNVVSADDLAEDDEEEEAEPFDDVDPI